MRAIVAADEHWGIGKDNKLLVSIPQDMKFFRNETTGKVIIMGRKTLESFPNARPLPNRKNIVLTRDMSYTVKDATVVHSVEEALAARELIKISVLQNCMEDPKEMAQVLSERTHSQVVQVIGKKIVLYREGKDDKKKIVLPGK